MGEIEEVKQPAFTPKRKSTNNAVTRFLGLWSTATGLVMQRIFSAPSRRETAWKPFERWPPRRWAKNRLDETAGQSVAYGYCLSAGSRARTWSGQRRSACGIAEIAGWVCSGLERRRRTRFVAWKVFPMSRVTTPLLALGPAKLARRNLICVQKQST